jgi:hypothetical protein
VLTANDLPSDKESTFIVLLFLTVLALAFGILGDGRDTLVADGPMTDAEVIQHRGFERVDQVAVLRVSHPTQEIRCEIPRNRFAGDWPPVGAVIPVESGGAYCDLPTWHVGVPRTELTILGTIGLAILGWWGWRTWAGRRRRRRSSDRASRERAFAHAVRARAESRRRKSHSTTTP